MSSRHADKSRLSLGDQTRLGLLVAPDETARTLGSRSGPALIGLPGRVNKEARSLQGYSNPKGRSVRASCVAGPGFRRELPNPSGYDEHEPRRLHRESSLLRAEPSHSARCERTCEQS